MGYTPAFQGEWLHSQPCFFGLSNPELSDLRVIDRAKTGGHYVPPNTVRDNFYGNLEKLNQHYTVVDDLRIIDTSETDHVLIAHLIAGKIQYAAPLAHLPSWFIQFLPAVYNLVSK
jgi:predicted ABC-type ATPase